MRGPEKYAYPITLQYSSKVKYENPLEEVWSQIEKFSIRKFLNKQSFQKSGEELDNILDYGYIRIKQSIEFRNSINKKSILTSPLVMYYSFLNLLRGITSIKYEIIPKNSHGIGFIKNPNILNCCAEIRNGTFTDYLDCHEIKYDLKDKISLKEALENIIEISSDLDSFSLNTNVIPLNVKLYMDGHISMYPLIQIQNLEQKWNDIFKDINGDFTYMGNNCFSTKPNEEFRANIDLARAYVNKKLYSDLIGHNQNDEYDIWYYINNNRNYNRVSYYFIVIFILGSIVRYEPDLIAKIESEENEYSWMINKTLILAERFFPQLLINEIYSNVQYY